ncbi:MAG: hypothetical protein KDD02_21665 [Phaeodactylibacter sp.]|nr:hypothetical protein [Phaeodactylibacter sp.]MCB9299382.1 hypothetical protein [Lewinellaceae bacterium]
MSEPVNSQQGEEKTPKSGALDEARQTYQAVDNFLTIRDTDSTLLMAGKILLRLLGIFIMILLSPFLLIGLTIAFAAAL